MGFKPYVCPSDNQAMNEFIEKMRVAQEEVKAALTKAKDNMACYYDRSRTPAPKYQPGDHVYLDVSDITTTWPSWKLSHRHLGPFLVERQVGPLAY